MNQIEIITGGQYFNFNDLKCDIVNAYVEWETTHPVYFHSYRNHIEPMVVDIRNTYNTGELLKYILFAWFHDFNYDPTISNANNVERAIELMSAYITPKCDMFWEVASMIRDTLYDEDTVMCDHIALDLKTLMTDEDCERHEILVYQEHTNIPFNVYREARIKVLQTLEDNVNKGATKFILNIHHRIKFLKTWSPKIGIFAGSFNPFHVGHYDVFKQASNIFDVVIIANGKNADKDETIDPQLPKRLEHLYHIYDGWLMEFANQFGANTSIVRGLRNGFDLDYEQNFKKYYYENGGLGNFVYLISSPEVAHVSSSAIRGLEKQFGVDVVKKYLVG